VSPEIVTILALIVIFAIATFLPINMGALAFVAAFLVGTLSVGLSTDEILGGFPSELVLTLIGVTYLFAIAKNNGTVDLIVKDWATILEEQSDDQVWDVTTTGTTLRPDPGSLFLLNVCDVAGWWCDEETMELVEQLRAESDFETRYEIFEQIQLNKYEQVPFIKNGDTMALTARYHTVHNLSPLLMIGPMLWNVWMEK
jgi:hypothetical protein